LDQSASHRSHSGGRPGEVPLTVRGLSEAFAAWSDEPIRRNSRIVVVEEDTQPRIVADHGSFVLLTVEQIIREWDWVAEEIKGGSHMLRIPEIPDERA
jgi:hypothetical protein